MNKEITTKKITMLFSLLVITCLILYPRVSVSAATRGIKLWFDTVFPALFPFFVSVELLNKSGFVKLLGIIMEPIMRPLFNIPGCGAFTFAIGLTSGYPMGAKVTSEMRGKNLISKIEGERMLAYCNNSGPLFILGAVGVGMFKLPALGNLLLFTHIIACITVALIFRFYRRDKSIISLRIKEKESMSSKLYKAWSTPMEFPDIGSLLGNSIKNSLNTILAIGGFIILFSVIIALLEVSIIPAISYAAVQFAGGLLDVDILKAVLSGFFEITTGSSMASSAENSSIIIKASTTALIIGWAGLSVHAQVLSIISSTDLSPKPYIAGKAMQSIFASIYTYLLLKLHPEFLLKAQAVTLMPGKDKDFINGLYYGGLLTGYYKFTLCLLVICFILASLKLVFYRLQKRLL